ncbi:flagellar hook-length control protein FliK [Melioribacteraceae bacterium 4301-Me]|uniref:flagellar hook-length control protein FliK n=1 Tax=Pyranulibacter aquaticus TaxID=3163344 RepID=UPI0035964804
MIMQFNPIFLFDANANSNTDQTKSKLVKPNYLFSDIIKINMDNLGMVDALPSPQNELANQNEMLSNLGFPLIGLVSSNVNEGMPLQKLQNEKSGTIGFVMPVDSSDVSSENLNSSTSVDAKETQTDIPLTFLIDFNQLLALLTQVKTDNSKETNSVSSNDFQSNNKFAFVKDFSLLADSNQLSVIIEKISSINGIDELKIHRLDTNFNGYQINKKPSVDDSLLNILNNQNANVEIVSNGLRFIIKSIDENKLPLEFERTYLGDTNNNVTDKSAELSQGVQLNSVTNMQDLSSKTTTQYANADNFSVQNKNFNINSNEKYFFIDVKPVNPINVNSSGSSAENILQNNFLVKNSKSESNNTPSKNINDVKQELNNYNDDIDIFFAKSEEKVDRKPVIFSLRNYDSLGVKVAAGENQNTVDLLNQFSTNNKNVIIAKNDIEQIGPNKTDENKLTAEPKRSEVNNVSDNASGKEITNKSNFEELSKFFKDAGSNKVNSLNDVKSQNTSLTEPKNFNNASSIIKNDLASNGGAEIVNTSLSEHSLPKNNDTLQQKNDISNVDKLDGASNTKKVIDTTKNSSFFEKFSDSNKNNNNTQSSNEKAFYIVDKMNNTLSVKPETLDSKLKGAVHIDNLIEELTKTLKNDDKKEIVLKLEPENLGKINISLEVHKNSISAKIQVENDLVKQLLKNNVELLQNALMENGLSVKNYSVTTNSEYKKSEQQNKSKRRMNVGKIESVRPSSVNIEIVKNMGYNTYDFIM